MVKYLSDIRFAIALLFSLSLGLTVASLAAGFWLLALVAECQTIVFLTVLCGSLAATVEKPVVYDFYFFYIRFLLEEKPNGGKKLRIQILTT